MRTYSLRWNRRCLIGALFAAQGLAMYGQTPQRSMAAVRREFMQDVASGSQALQAGNNAAAEKAFRQALALDPRSVELLNNLALSVARQGRLKAAIDLYKRALQVKPGDPITERNLAVTYFSARRYKDAAPLLEDFAKKTPNFQLLYLTGLDLFALNEYKASASYLERASRLRPNDLSVLDVLGRAYWRVKNYSGVIKAFDRIMTVNPHSPEAHFMLGLAYDIAYREKDATRQFEAVLAEDPNYPGVHRSLGIIDWREHRISAAKEQFHKELIHHPNDPISNYMLGQILRKEQHPAEALPYLQEAVKVNPSYRDALFQLGQCYLALKKPAKAVVPLEQAVHVDPKYAETHFILGKAYSLLGRKAEAARQWAITRRIQQKRNIQPDTARKPHP